MYYSSPHFLYGTQSLLDGVIGVNPVKEEHMVYFDIQMVGQFSTYIGLGPVEIQKLNFGIIFMFMNN